MSRASNFDSSSDELDAGSAPRALIRSLIFGIREHLDALGVQARDDLGRRAGGREQPVPARGDFTPLTPCADSTFSSGSAASRFGPTTASAFSLPDLMCGMVVAESNMKSIWPASRSFTAGASPLYGT